MTGSGALAQGVMVERYEVLDLLGVGGIATVYRARHRDLRSLHALKVLTIDRPSLRERALREGQVQASIRHPNIVAVTDIVTCGGAPALVLEYVAGPSLDRLLATRVLGLAEIDLLVRGILRGVAHAHAHGVVHRDLKPGNVLVAEVDGQRVPKITDFGIVKLLLPKGDPRRTQTGQPMGTPQYMSPEQFGDASQVDTRSDIWSLGVMLYELCTGRRPFPGPSTAELFAQASSGCYPPPQSLVDGLPERMVRAIAGALEPDPARRLPSVAALLTTWSGEVTDQELEIEPRPAPSEPQRPVGHPPPTPQPVSTLSQGPPRSVRPEVVGLSLAVLGVVGSTAALAALGVLVGIGLALSAG